MLIEKDLTSLKKTKAIFFLTLWGHHESLWLKHSDEGYALYHQTARGQVLPQLLISCVMSR